MASLFKKKQEQQEPVQEQPTFKVEKVIGIPQIPDFPDKTKIDCTYPLIPPYVNVHIYWRQDEVIYEVQEPKLSEKEESLLKTLEDGIREIINLSFISVKDKETIFIYLEKNIQVLLKELSVVIPNETYLKIMYYIYRDFVGLNRIEPFLNDYYIEDIECNGVNTPIYIVHRKFRNLKTNIIYTDINEMASFVEKLAQKCGKYISYAEPLLDGSLEDGSVEFNEPFIYKEEGIIKISKIGEVIDKFYNNNESNIPKKACNLEVPVFDKTFKIIWKPLDYVYRHKINDKLFKLKLETGKEITLSSAHSLFILNEKGIETIKTKSLQKGNYIIIPSRIPETKPIKEINLIDCFLNSNLKRKIVLKNVPNAIYKEKEAEIKSYLKENYKKLHQSFYDFKTKKILPISLYSLLSPIQLKRCKLSTTSHHQIPITLKITKELIRLLGYYSAEGWLTKIKAHHRIYFCFNKNEKEYINEVCNSFKKCFNLTPYIEKEDKNGVKIVVNNILVKFIFEKVLGVTKYAKYKEIPWIIYNIPNNLKEEYVKAWSNGNYNSAASKKFISDLAYLHLFNEKNISINPITSVIKGRNINSTEFYSNEIIRNPAKRYSDMIPMEVFNPLNEMHMNFSNKRVSKERLKNILNDARFKRLENLSENLPKQFIIEWSKRGFIKNKSLTLKGIKALNEKLVLDILINSDLGFVKIKNIEEVTSDYPYVYDVSVPGCENFISGMGGIFCHNSRVNATYTRDVSSRGPSITIRKFTKEPWSPIQLMQKGTVNQDMLAYLWILIEYEKNVMIIGGTGAGKTSLLNVIAFFIPPEARIVSIEDTRELAFEHENWLPSVARPGVGMSNILGAKHGEVSLFDLLKESFRQRPDYVIVGEVRGSIRGDEEICIVEDGITKRVPIKELENKDISKMLVPTLDENKKISLHPIKHFIKHPKREKLLEIVTKTGRRVTITEDHSLFTSEGCKIIPIEGRKLKEGYSILIPSNMPYGYNNIKKIKIIDYLGELRLFNVQDKVKQAISKIGQKRSDELLGVVARQYCRKKQKSSIPIGLFYKLMREANMDYDKDEFDIKSGNSKLIPKEIPVNEDFCRFLGYYAAEGHIQSANREIVITNSNKDIIKDVVNISKKLFGINPVIKPVVGFGTSNHILIRSAILVRLLLKLGVGKKEKKRIPSFIYGLSINKICAYLRGLYSGDGNNYKNDITLSSKLLKLCEDVMYSLLCLGIVSKLKKEKNKNMYRVSFKRIEDTKRFLDMVGFVNRKYDVLQKGYLHSSSNIINFNISDFKSMNLSRKYRHLKRFMRCSKYYLKKIIDKLGANEDIKRFVNGEFYLDKIKEINKINLNEPEHVYDLSINPTENFIGGFGGLILHNSEAYVLFQGMASGHPSMGTMHANSVSTMVRRLETPPINLSGSLVESMDAVCVIAPTKVKGKDVRRVTEIEEVVQVKEGLGGEIINHTFKWNPVNDTYLFNPNSHCFKKISTQYGISMENLLKEMKLRSYLLASIYKNKIFNFKDVQKVIHEYYKSPQEVLRRFGIIK